MTPTGNLPSIQVREEPERWIQNKKQNKNKKTYMAEKEDDTDSTATMTTVIFAPTTITAEKEDGTDSTATVITAAFTSVCGSKWDNGIIERLAEITTVNDHIYVFGKRRWVKPSRKWKTSTSQVCKKEKQSKLDIAGNI